MLTPKRSLFAAHANAGTTFDNTLCVRPAPILFIAIAMLSCTDLPRDPRKTLQNVATTHLLRVGIAEDPPFIVRAGDEARGIEADLIRGFAAAHGATVRWRWLPQEAALEALHANELDLVAPVDATTPWKKKVALTRPFVEVSEVVARRSRELPDALQHLVVAVEESDPIAERLERKKVTVKRVEHIGASDDLAAGTRLHLRQLGFSSMRVLEKKKRVFATPPGENAFLLALEQYLATQRESYALRTGEDAP